MPDHIVFIRIRGSSYVYDNFLVTEDGVRHSADIGPVLLDETELWADGILVHYFIRELRYCIFYRQRFIRKHLNQECAGALIQLTLVQPQQEIVDYKWNYRMEYLVRERCELEHTLSWLSTLGGAFSALGDYFVNCAEIAGKISLNQLKLAMRLHDPGIVSRCRLYLGLSLIQRGQLKLARFIVYNEYVKAKSGAVVDVRLINMCQGIWCKLKYEYELFKRQKCISFR